MLPILIYTVAVVYSRRFEFANSGNAIAGLHLRPFFLRNIHRITAILYTVVVHGDYFGSLMRFTKCHVRWLVIEAS